MPPLRCPTEATSLIVILRRSRRIPARSARRRSRRFHRRDIGVPPMCGPKGAALNLRTRLKPADYDLRPSFSAPFRGVPRLSPVPLGPGIGGTPIFASAPPQNDGEWVAVRGETRT
jgi:hypothetical protein